MSEIDFIDVKKVGIKEKVRKQLIEVEKEYTVNHKPFCYKAAKEYYEDLIDQRILEAQRKEGRVTEQDLRLPKFNFNQFGDIKKFNKISEQDALDNVKKGNTVIQEVTGKHINYVYEPKGYGVSVFVPNSTKKDNKKEE